MTMRIPAARAVALQAVLVERERQDAKHGFDPTRPTGFGGWWTPMLDRALHWLYELAKWRGRLTWRHTLLEEVGEVLAARTTAEAVKELREVAAVCVKVEEALVAGGQWPAPDPLCVGVLELRRLAPVSTPAEWVGGPPEEMGTARIVHRAELAFRAYAARVPRESRTVADCQALLGAMEMAQLMGANPAALAEVENPAELGAAIARLSRALPPAGGVQ